MPETGWILNGLPSKNVENDWRFETAVRAGIVSRDVIPESKDLREPWWDVGNQKHTGSCVGWAVGDGVCRWHFVKAGRIAKDERLSPRYLWMAAKETDDDTSQPTSFIEEAGTTLKAALDVARVYGVVRESVLPFEPPTLYAHELDTFYAIASQLKIASYFNLAVNLSEWKQWVAFNGPLAARLVFDQTFDSVKKDGLLDVYRPYPKKYWRRQGHFVAIVGYDAGHFLIRNSWNDTWGDEGFGYATLEYAKDAFTEAYGISV
ncbi:MAG TPA: C1 family peptidase [Rhizomicrobium sp.]